MRVASLVLVTAATVASTGCKDVKLEAAHRSEAQMAGHVREARAGVERLTRSFVPVLEGLAPSLVQSMTTHDVPGVRFTLIGMGSQNTPAGSLSFFPTGFIAAVGPDGLAIARNIDETRDLMRGMPMRTLFPSVASALGGNSRLGVGELPASPDMPSRVELVAAVPVRDVHGAILGALAAGISYGQLARAIDTAVRVHAGQEPVLWVGLQHGGRVLPSGRDRDVPARWLVPASLIGRIPADAAQRINDGTTAPFVWTFIEESERGWAGAIASVPPLEGTRVLIFRSEAMQR